MLYRGLDAALREAAGDFALLRERITDTAPCASGFWPAGLG